MKDDCLSVQLIAKPGPGLTGTSRYVENLYCELPAAGMNVTRTYPESFNHWAWLRGKLREVGLDVQAFFRSYPLRAKLEDADLYHLTSQTLGILLLFNRFNKPVVITVLDIIPYLLRNDRIRSVIRGPMETFFYMLALAGLRRADALIAISEYTRRTLVEELKLPPEKIHVIYLGVDHQNYRPLNVPESFWAKYGIKADEASILYVGSDDPHKNLKMLIKAYASVTQRGCIAKLCLVTGLHNPRRRAALLELAAQLGVMDGVMFFDAVPEQDLPFFYNAASVLVMPSIYEGFGLPVLEAMACGTPVVCSNAASLPEIVGNAAILTNPDDVKGLSQAICTLLSDQGIWERQCQMGLEQSAQFTWPLTAEKTAIVYSATAKVNSLNSIGSNRSHKRAFFLRSEK